MHGHGKHVLETTDTVMAGTTPGCDCLHQPLWEWAVPAALLLLIEIAETARASNQSICPDRGARAVKSRVRHHPVQYRQLTMLQTSALFLRTQCRYQITDQRQMRYHQHPIAPLPARKRI